MTNGAMFTTSSKTPQYNSYPVFNTNSFTKLGVFIFYARSKLPTKIQESFFANYVVKILLR